MSSFYARLPSFATDYSGFLSLLHGLGGLMVVHDPSGCLGNYTNCDEPRWYHEPQPVYSSTIRELEAIIGDYSETIVKIKDEVQRKKPPFACVMGTPIPALTGCDVEAIARTVEGETGVPCFGIATDGFKFYTDGIRRALDLLYEKFMDKEVVQNKGTVNIIGMTPLDYSIYGETDKLISYISDIGYQVQAFVGMGKDFDSVVNACKAEKNILMNADALPLAKKMLKNHSIPYWVGPPCGENGIREMKAFLRGSSGKIPTGHKKADRVLIIGEQACSNAMRGALRSDKGYQNVSVATFFTLHKDLAEENDVHLDCEDSLTALLHDNIFDMIIGDPLFKSLCDKNQNYYSVPHPAVSSKIYWKDTPSWIG